MGIDSAAFASAFDKRWNNGQESEAEATGPGAPLWPPALDLRALAQREPEEPRFVVQDWLPAGYATLLAGHGGAGKSSIALHLAACIASGLDWWGMPVQRRRVMYLSCEDRENVVHWRLARICNHLGLDMADLADWLDVRDLVGKETILWRSTSTGSPLTPAYHELAGRMQEAGADVLMVDGVTDAFGGNENDRAEVKAFVNALLSLISQDDGAVILVGHVNKPSAAAASTSEGYSGSTAWHNAVRARWYLYPEVERDDDEDRARPNGNLTLELQKSNLGRTDQTIGFRWDIGARLFVGEPPETGVVASIREQNERKSILEAMAAVTARGEYVPAATTGSRTAYHVLAASGKLDKKLQSGAAGRKRFWRRIEELRSMGEVREGSIRRSDRKRTATLEPASQADCGVRQCG